MSDTFSPQERSEIMRRVKSGRNRSTELRLVEFFKKEGITGWRRNFPLLGKPDFVFPKKRVAVFADGCFWHGHDCRNTRPQQNKPYWEAKRKRNLERDLLVNEGLAKKGWTVVRIWECEIKKGAFERLLNALQP
jgi:DNA mismatch endonuclease, patch repair protein